MKFSFYFGRRIGGGDRYQSGFTLIELMVVVAIIGILVAIALPQYRNYVQVSANGSCMLEARSYMATAVSDFANNETPKIYGDASYPNESCLSMAGQLDIVAYSQSGDVIFASPIRGNINMLQYVQCNVSNGNCQYIDP